MVYVSGGNMVENRSLLRLSIFPEMFWGIVNFFCYFFTTLVPGMDSNKSASSNSRGNPGDGPGFPRRRMGGFHNRGGGPSPPPMAGGG